MNNIAYINKYFFHCQKLKYYS